MDLFNRTDLQALLAERPGPHLSIYLPTRRGGWPENSTRWRHALSVARDRLQEQGLAAAETARFVDAARRVGEDADLWRSMGDGLAWFQAPEFHRFYRLPWTFAERVDCSARFIVKPLLPLLTGDGRFFVLALSQKGVRLFQGSRQAVSPIDVKALPKNLADTLKYDEKFEPLTFHSRPTGGGGWGAIFSGHGVGIDDHKDDLLRYFQDIDRALHALLKEERAPLVLASVDYFWPLYRKANTYAHLLDTGVSGNPDHLDAKTLHDRAWQLVQPQFERAVDDALAQFERLRGTGRTTGRLEDVVAAAVGGQVERLIVAADREVPGGFEPATQRIWVHDDAQPADEDLLNLAAVHALAHGRTVYALPSRRIPGGGSAAAIYCLPLAKHAGKHH